MIGFLMRYFLTAAVRASSGSAVFGFFDAEPLSPMASPGRFTPEEEEADCCSSAAAADETLSEMRWSSSAFFCCFRSIRTGSSGAASESDESEPLEDDEESLDESSPEEDESSPRRVFESPPDLADFPCSPEVPLAFPCLPSSLASSSSSSPSRESSFLFCCSSSESPNFKVEEITQSYSVTLFAKTEKGTYLYR